MNVIESNPLEIFICYSKLGSGNFSSGIFKVQDPETLKFYALKKLSGDQDLENSARSEFFQSALSPSNNIVKSYALYKHKNEFFILSELLSTDLANFILLNQIPDDVCIYILKEILKGIDFIHSNNQIHRDIKSDNIFISETGNIKIGDFGNTVKLSADNQFRKTLAGSPLWLSPEIVLGESYSFPSDIWSFGIIAIELVDGKPPHSQARSFRDLFLCISNGPVPKISSRSAPLIEEVVEACLRKNPNDRKTAKELLRFPVFQQNYEYAQEFIIKILNK